MAQKYGGKFSPDGPTNAPSPYKDAKPKKAGARSNFLFIAPLPLLGTIWGGEGLEFMLRAGAFGTLMLAAWLTREGILAQEAYDARTVARKPAIPRKIFGSILIGLGITLAAWGKNELLAILPGLVGAALHLFAFGPDPLRNKGIGGVDTFQQDRVAQAIDKAEKNLELMSTAISDLGDRRIEQRVEQFQTTARSLFRRVEEDPQDLTAAKKFLSVYLMGAKDATEKFATVYKRNRDLQTWYNFRGFLDEIEDTFDAKTESLLANNKTDLEIEMKVLRDRLAREGLPTDR